MEITAAPAHDAVAERIAHALIEGFDRHFSLFREETGKAKQRFDDADWEGAQQAVRSRIRFYDARVKETLERLAVEFTPAELSDVVWPLAKLRYTGLLVDHKQPELAETFFNSVTTRILRRPYGQDAYMFVRAAISTEDIASDPPTYRSYYPRTEGLRATFLRLIADFGWARPFADLDRDVDHALRALLEHRGGQWPTLETNHQLQVLGSAFYRNKAAYVIGKIVNGMHETPFAIPVLHDAEGRLYLDTILLDAESIAILFSLSRSYFMVDMEVPSGYVQFLQSLMPTKPRSELYTALGFVKQGKTMFFRDFLHHLRHSEDLFVEAPGTPGQVMHVFTLPSYPYVLKVIKDRFGPTKTLDRETVKQKFRMIKEVDRVGRMVDALEFVDLALPAARFGPELLAQLEQLAPSMIEHDSENLVVKHCYVERRMTPLNMFLERAEPAELDRVVADYGEAIKELAIANIFAGDLLWRNFGLTRYGRVVFYDYDEIEYLTDCNFRSIPPAPHIEDELSDEAWYRVGPHDVFPEEFERFVLGAPALREVFLREHRDLLSPEFWQDCQQRVGAGEVVDFFPYDESVRFSNRYREETGLAAVAAAR
jgi:isocitrate dehydrogenase kinase/phosphatase